MGKHITDEQRDKIKALCKDGICSIETSKILGIPHRTVKLWYEKDPNIPQECTKLKGLKLYCYQELARLLCWPAPKLLNCLKAYEQKLDIKKRGTLAKFPRSKMSSRTIQRYLEAWGVMANTRKIWDANTIALHAVRIAWWEHRVDDSKVMPVDNSSKQVTGWLLVAADRELVNVKDKSRRDLVLKFALMTGDKINYEKALRLIGTTLHSADWSPRSVYLVTDKDGKPTAVDNIERLKENMQGVDISIDKPTTVNGPIEIKASFPNPRAVENYLAALVFLGPKGEYGLPDFKNDNWRQIFAKITDDNFLESQIDGSKPIMVL